MTFIWSCSLLFDRYAAVCINCWLDRCLTPFELSVVIFCLYLEQIVIVKSAILHLQRAECAQCDIIPLLKSRQQVSNWELLVQNSGRGHWAN